MHIQKPYVIGLFWKLNFNTLLGLFPIREAAMSNKLHFCLGSCSTPASSTETARGKQHLAILQQLIRLTTSAFCFCTINETSKRKAAKRQAVPHFKVLQQLDKADHIITYVNN
ncbi:Protein adenylyltransferase and cysteine protease IbpA [Frankliniella fusca]|uniref:Protein adenylyltransferase and cysteine protease IbpA n=1 Tax=Frankliniella fusca TaxID=407009 RepID=A0AAE1LRK3_9NEOP|nr:Protein adenylyltransferase and cysteine protease IbpA [Frankliniella fusca]